MPASSLYCCQRSDSRISAAARKRRIAASPSVRPPLASAAAVSANSPAPTAPAPTAAPLSKNDRRLVDSPVSPMTPPVRNGCRTRRDTGHRALPVSTGVSSITYENRQQAGHPLGAARMATALRLLDGARAGGRSLCRIEPHCTRDPLPDQPSNGFEPLTPT